MIGYSEQRALVGSCSSPRQRALGQYWIIAGVLLMGAAFGVPEHLGINLALTAATALAFYEASPRHELTWLALGPLVDAVVPAAVWPVPAAAAVIVFAAATRLGPAIFLGGWIPVKKWIGPSLIVITVSASAVWIWDSLVDRGAAIEFRSGVVDAVENPILFLLAASGAAFLNAVVEESLWQGVLLRTVKGQGISAVASVAIVASSFGATHYNGLPGGPSGIFLATVFGGIMGILYFRFRSLWPLVITHFVIDLILFTLVL